MSVALHTSCVWVYYLTFIEYTVARLYDKGLLLMSPNPHNNPMLWVPILSFL